MSLGCLCSRQLTILLKPTEVNYTYIVTAQKGPRISSLDIFRCVFQVALIARILFYVVVGMESQLYWI